MSRTYYLKIAGGLHQWLEIRGFKAIKEADTRKEVYELEVSVNDQKKFMVISNPYGEMFNIEFKDDSNRPVSFIRIIKHFKDKSIGLRV